ncbi:hypothetical protein ACE4V3_05230 (plasmid) [Borrelia recurrentis]|uniref:Uncharacterized protein n=1 Tax=Borrelia recurrentis (strain A1) TaxID=412418 RepID=B5RRT6_BORRA|nr:hypothetical protein [Borrelia recurrentis]ACH95072.1 hypothetical protein BRE_1007 [Borrelia recurrentis A1]
MQRVYRLIFLLSILIFSVLILCCKHWGDETHGTNHVLHSSLVRARPESISSSTVKNVQSKFAVDDFENKKLNLDLEVGLTPSGHFVINQVRTTDSNKPNLKTNVVDSLGSDVLDKDVENPSQDKEVNKEEELVQVEEETEILKKNYAMLQAKIEELKTLYYSRPRMFDENILNNIERKLDASYSELYKNNIYAVIKGDMEILSKLDLMLIYLFLVWDGSYTYFRDLLNVLQHISMSLIFRIINENGSIFDKSNLVALQSSKDVLGLKELVSNLDSICLKWNRLVGLIKDQIVQASIFYHKDELIKHLSPIINLFVRSDNYKNDPIRLLKDEILDLIKQVETQVYKLKAEE